MLPQGSNMLQQVSLCWILHGLSMKTIPQKLISHGYVQMNTSNTGEPGRDGGCYLGYVAAPKIIAGTQNLARLQCCRYQNNQSGT